jgi:hypothetical protein
MAVIKCKPDEGNTEEFPRKYHFKGPCFCKIGDENLPSDGSKLIDSDNCIRIDHVKAKCCGFNLFAQITTIAPS